MDKQYFSHDLGARRDEKLVNLRADLGWEGYGIYWSLIETLYEHDNLYHMKSLKALAFDLQVEIDKLMIIVKDYGLFEYDEECFWSNGVAKRLDKRNAIIEKRREAGRSRGRQAAASVDTKTSEQMEDTRSANAQQEQSKCSEDKEHLPSNKKEIKEKEKKSKLCVDTHSAREASGVSVSTTDSAQKSKNDEALAQEFIDLYHRHCPGLPRVEHPTPRVRSGIGHILALMSHDMEAVAKILAQVGGNKFLNGGGPNGWKASLPWLVEDDRWDDIRNGKFEPGTGAIQNANSMIYHTKKELKGF